MTTLRDFPTRIYAFWKGPFKDSKGGFISLGGVGKDGAPAWMGEWSCFSIKLLMIKRKIVEAPVVDRNYIN
jgi:hypothetical protein